MGVARRPPLGLPSGILLGRGLLRLVTRTINDLYFVVAVREVMVTPCRRSTRAPRSASARTAAGGARARARGDAPAPRAALSRVAPGGARAPAPAAPPAGRGRGCSRRGRGARSPWPARRPGAELRRTLRVLLGGGPARPGDHDRAGARWLRAAWPPRRSGCSAGWPRAAWRRPLSRTAVAIAALMIAVAATVGVGMMIESFRQSVGGLAREPRCRPTSTCRRRAW